MNDDDEGNLDDRMTRIGDIVRARPTPPPVGRPTGGLLPLAELDKANRQAFRDARELTWPTVVPDRYEPARLDDLEPGLRRRLAGWVEAPCNLLMFGPVGTGKTHALVAALRELWCQGCPVAYWTSASLLAGLDWRNEGRDLVSRGATTTPVVVLDDLGAGQLSEWALSMLMVVVDTRWANALPTACGTNLGPEALIEALGERIYSRLGHGATAIELGGIDRRLGR